VFSGMDIQTGELVAIAEWTIKWHSFKRKLNMHDEEENKESAKYLKQVMVFIRIYLTFVCYC
jgi:hypothetical protein